VITCKQISLKVGSVQLKISSSYTSSTDSVEDIEFGGSYDISLKRIEGTSDLIFDSEKRCPIIFYENKEYWIQFNFDEPKDIESNNILEVIRKSEDRKTYIIRFNSVNYVGIINLSLYGIYQSIIEVESKKIDYQEEYNLLLLKISELGIDLTTRASSFFQVPVSHTDRIENDSHLLNSKLSFIRSKILSGEFEALYNSFLRKPFTKITVKHSEKYVWELEQFDLNNYLDGMYKETITSYDGSVLPLKVVSEFYDDTIDTIENQFIKHLLEIVLQLLNSVLVKVSLMQISFLKLEIEECITRCERILSNQIFQNISKLKYFPSKSNVLQTKHPYKELYRIYMLLFYEVEISDETLNTSMTTSLKDLPKLYEYWCFLNIVEILNTKYGEIDLIQQGFIKYNQDNLCFLIGSPEDGLTYIVNENKKIKLFYSKNYTSENIIYSGRSYSHTLDPDISVELFFNDVLVAIIHFDAKYKLDNFISFKNEDLDKMHTYKDAILGSIGAYVLYPGKETKNFIQEEKNQELADIIFPSVGAFVFNINNNNNAIEKNAIYNVLEKFINIETHLTSNGIFDENLKRYNYLKRLID
jgi:predicted component of viral defense system (DUF524 family)